MKTLSAIAHRICVIGTSGSGKTTTAAQIAHAMQIKHIELDALHWGPNWSETPINEFRKLVTISLSGSFWVVDGNYGKIRDIVWPRADTVIWLDYSFPLIMWQLIRRTIQRVSLRQELWAGNQESLTQSFLSKGSILLWALNTYRANKTKYPKLFAMPQHSHLSVVHIKNPAKRKQWLAQLSTNN